MTLSVLIYGFGSAFSGKISARDIDLLIVHPTIDLASCRLAIACKRGLNERVPLVHVTMLSVAEEEHFKFVQAASAVRLGSVRGEKLENDLDVLVKAIREAVVQTQRVFSREPVMTSSL